MLHATAKFAQMQYSTAAERDPRVARVLEVGTGNGTLALQLAGSGFHNVTGSDYSQKSIQLAQAVAQHLKVTGVNWVLDDILDTHLQPG